MTSNIVNRNKLRPLALTAVVFFTVSGGPYGLEPLLQDVGGTAAIFLIVFTPLIWVIPVALMVLELNAMMPRNGGYYQWVKTALGVRWGFLEGWWTWLYTFTDLAIYPVLFIQYLSFFVPEVESYRPFLCFAVIWVCVGLNLLGIVPVGRWSVALSVGVLIPFLLLFAEILVKGGFSETHAAAQTSTGDLSALGLGLFTVMWNYLGWDNSSTVAEEVEKPVRSYLIAIFAALLLIIATYVLSVLAAWSSGIEPELLQREGFPALGSAVGGWTLGALLSLGGMASALGLFLSTLLSVSRVPGAMASDGLLPAALARLHPKYGVPHLSIIVCAVVVSVMVVWSFSELVVIDVSLYGAAIMLELVSLIALRRRQPNAHRPVKIPLNFTGVVVVSCLPVLCLVVALLALASRTGIHMNAVIFAMGAVLTGPLAWWMITMRRKWELRREP